MPCSITITINKNNTNSISSWCGARAFSERHSVLCIFHEHCNRIQKGVIFCVNLQSETKRELIRIKRSRIKIKINGKRTIQSMHLLNKRAKQRGVLVSYTFNHLYFKLEKFDYNFWFQIILWLQSNVVRSETEEKNI